MDDALKALAISAVFGLMTGGGALAAGKIIVTPLVELSVGKSVIIHGARSNTCGSPPPAWTDLEASLPSSSLGAFSDGGVGTRLSARCNGPTPARAIKFTAKTKGSEKVYLEGDRITITVK